MELVTLLAANFYLRLQHRKQTGRIQIQIVLLVNGLNFLHALQLAAYLQGKSEPGLLYFPKKILLALKAMKQ